MRERGLDPDAPATRTTIETNTRLVPKRAINLLNALEALTEVRSLAGLQVVEGGCGFGALAAYLAVTARPAHLVAIDVREDYIASADASARPLGLGGSLEYRRDDMRTFQTIDDASADVVILNNAFLYLPTRRDMAAAAAALARITKPGGHVLLYQANKWVYRDPFTKSPLVHLAPAWAARWLGRLTGLQHSHGRVRLLSPPAVMRLMWRHGFDALGYGAFGPQGFSRGRAAWGAGFFAAAGRRRR